MDDGAVQQVLKLDDIHVNVLRVENVETRSDDGLSVGVHTVLALRRERHAAVVNADIVHTSKLGHCVEEKPSHVGRGVGNGDTAWQHENDIREARPLCTHEDIRGKKRLTCSFG